mgnify:CR=1 FL=1
MHALLSLPMCLFHLPFCQPKSPVLSVLSLRSCHIQFVAIYSRPDRIVYVKYVGALILSAICSMHMVYACMAQVSCCDLLPTRSRRIHQICWCFDSQWNQLRIYIEMGKNAQRKSRKNSRTKAPMKLKTRSYSRPISPQALVKFEKTWKELESVTAVA